MHHNITYIDTFPRVLIEVERYHLENTQVDVGDWVMNSVPLARATRGNSCSRVLVCSCWLSMHCWMLSSLIDGIRTFWSYSKSLMSVRMIILSLYLQYKSIQLRLCGSLHSVSTSYYDILIFKQWLYSQIFMQPWLFMIVVGWYTLPMQRHKRHHNPSERWIASLFQSQPSNTYNSLVLVTVCHFYRLHHCYQWPTEQKSNEKEAA